MKVLLLGDRGLLGTDLKLFDNFYNKLNIVVLDAGIPKWPSEEFKKAVLTNQCDVIINAISTIDYYNKDIIELVHYHLPLWLVKNKNCKVILFSSDVVNQFESGYIDEKFKYYAVAKQQMEKDLASESNALCIRTSFLGLTKTSSNLIYRVFELTENQPIEVNVHANWSGMTTLEFYKLLTDGRLKQKESGLLVLGGKKESIYQLFTIINNLFNYSKEIRTISNNFIHTARSAPSDIRLPSIPQQLKDLCAVAQVLENPNLIKVKCSD